MTRLSAAGGGFLLAVLWMDLMFDVQALRLGGPPAGDAQILHAIAAYYGRVTTDAFPMNRLIAVVMLVTVGAGLVGALRGGSGRALRIVSALLSALPVGLAVLRVFPNAVRLGSAVDPFEVQAGLARAILWDHVACFAAMASFTALQVGGAGVPSGRGGPGPSR